ncbi:hypothetical protein BC835DRAFT_1303060 [Cytidiella melzeri]|nr:hypothetical protein BC835DRAFT_1303060 [Cytidiella melzeri]
MFSSSLLLAASAATLPLVAGHVAIFTESMWGLSVTQTTFSYDNRAVVPLYGMTFDHWWFHNHLAYPPAAGKFTDLPAGGSVTVQLSCDIGYTDVWQYGPGGDNRQSSDLACPGQPSTAIHANDINDVAGSAIAIAYKSDVNDVKPEDFVIISTKRQSPWYLNNDFQIPAGLPACPEGGCICAWFWIHEPDSGSEQMYMNGFRCTVSGNTGTVPIGKPGLARRCQDVPSNCTVGPVNPIYWYQLEGNNYFEGTYSPPMYNEVYGFPDGAMPNLFQDATVGGTPATVATASSTDVSASSSPAATSASPADASASPAAPSGSPADASESPAATSASPTSSPPASTVDTASASETSAVVAVAPAPTDIPTPSSSDPSSTPTASTKKCKRRSSNKRRRSALKNHLQKRLSHDGRTF